MKKRLIGNMTGNSMDAIDLVLTEFDDDKMTDICTYSKPYTADMQQKIENLRRLAFDKTREEIENIPEFKEVHDTYVAQIAECVNEMCAAFGLNKQSIDAIGFHGKTLDHNPPSKAAAENTSAYTLQIGSGQMLADLTGIKVVYDFRSAPLMAGYDGAPLVSPHNAHIAAAEGDGCYYNGGNTSNFALIVDGKALIGADAGPFNEYTDNFIRRFSAETYDKDGMFGSNGILDINLMQYMFGCCRDYYERELPKSGDPAYYHKDKIFAYVTEQGIKFNDAVKTFEYFAAYTAVQALTLVPEKMPMPARMVLFGGGWKNPVVRDAFAELLQGEGYILPQHKKAFARLRERLGKAPEVKISSFGDFMEARLFADLARYKLENRAWELPEAVSSGHPVICGVVAEPGKNGGKYRDMINLAAKGWQSAKSRP